MNESLNKECVLFEGEGLVLLKLLVCNLNKMKP